MGSAFTQIFTVLSAAKDYKINESSLFKTSLHLPNLLNLIISSLISRHFSSDGLSKRDNWVGDSDSRNPIAILEIIKTTGNNLRRGEKERKKERKRN